MDVVRVRQVRLMHFHEVDAHEERLVRRLRRLVEIVERGLLDIAVEERNADHALAAVDDRGVDILAVDLEIFSCRPTSVARQRALGHALERGAQLRRHVGEPGRIGIGVGVQVVEADIPHLVVAVCSGICVVRFAEVPLAGEEGLVAAGLEHGCQRPFRRRQPAWLTLEGHSGHPAAVRKASSLHGGAAGRATRLRVEGEERHALGRNAVNVRGRHAAADAAAVGPEVAVAGVVRYQQDDVGPLLLRLLRGCWRAARSGQRERRNVVAPINAAQDRVCQPTSDWRKLLRIFGGPLLRMQSDIVLHSWFDASRTSEQADQAYWRRRAR